MTLEELKAEAKRQGYKLIKDENIHFEPCLCGGTRREWWSGPEGNKVKIEALRPVTREQVEKVWRGEWIAYLDGEHIMPERYYSCSKCGGRGHLSKRNFCDFCGAPMTDKAVDMVIERLEALGYGKDD